jgi:limonene 1,2-monooxygenase
MLMGHEWANPEATRRSFELFAEYVIPEVNRASAAKLTSQQSFFEHLEVGKQAGATAVKEAIAKYETSAANG